MVPRTKNGMKVRRLPVPLLETGFCLVAQVNDARDVHLEHAVNVSTGAARLDHSLCDDASHIG